MRVFEAQGVVGAVPLLAGAGDGHDPLFSAEERRDMVADDGRIGITCEFCSRRYDLDPAEVEAELGGAKH